jgi:hypothetical protein
MLDPQNTQMLFIVILLAIANIIKIYITHLKINGF